MKPPGPDPSELPAPYRNPWGLLAGDLRAVLASLRLKVRELARRNGEGDLPVPGFWPRPLAPWFWPALLTVLVALTVRLLVAAPAPAPPGTALQVPWAATPEGAEPAAQAAPAEAPADEADSIEAGPIEAPPLRLDPLLALLAQHDPNGLITAARPQPARSLLQLELGEGFADLADLRRIELAEGWLERATSLGYETLELVDQGGHLLGRSALVGTGMIVLEPSMAG